VSTNDPDAPGDAVDGDQEASAEVEDVLKSKRKAEGAAAAIHQIRTRRSNPFRLAVPA
jgi:hypothetical protein